VHAGFDEHILYKGTIGPQSSCFFVLIVIFPYSVDMAYVGKLAFGVFGKPRVQIDLDYCVKTEFRIVE